MSWNLIFGGLVKKTIDLFCGSSGFFREQPSRSSSSHAGWKRVWGWLTLLSRGNSVSSICLYIIYIWLTIPDNSFSCEHMHMLHYLYHNEHWCNTWLGGYVGYFTWAGERWEDEGTQSSNCSDRGFQKVWKEKKTSTWRYRAKQKGNSCTAQTCRRGVEKQCRLQRWKWQETAKDRISKGWEDKEVRPYRLRLCSRSFSTETKLLYRWGRDGKTEEINDDFISQPDGTTSSVTLRCIYMRAMASKTHRIS